MRRRVMRRAADGPRIVEELARHCYASSDIGGTGASIHILSTRWSQLASRSAVWQSSFVEGILSAGRAFCAGRNGAFKVGAIGSSLVLSCRSPAMADPVEVLVVDLLEWIGPNGRPYCEVMEAWRTSCPRLPVWEEANERGFIERHWLRSEAMISVSALGARVLAERRHLGKDRRGGCPK
jgi:hypothetical protein